MFGITLSHVFIFMYCIQFQSIFFLYTKNKFQVINQIHTLNLKRRRRILTNVECNEQESKSPKRVSVHALMVNKFQTIISIFCCRREKSSCPISRTRVGTSSQETTLATASDVFPTFILLGYVSLAPPTCLIDSFSTPRLSRTGV